MATYSVGTSVLRVIPDFTGLQRDVEKAAEKIKRSLRDAVRDGLSDTTVKTTAARQGSVIGGTLADNIKSKLEAALRTLPTPTIGAATTEAEQKIRELREQIGSLSARIGVDLSSEDAIKETAKLEAQLRALSENSTDLDIKANADQAQRVLAAVRLEAERIAALRPEVQLRANASSFTRTVRTALAETAAALPTITVSANTTPAEREVDLVRQRISQLAADVGVNLDADEALVDIAALEAQLEALSQSTTSLDVRADADRARAALAAIRAEAERLNGLTPTVVVEAEANQGEFTRKVREALAAAQAALPDLVIDADSSPAERELAAIRTELAALGDRKIGVDISAADALAQAAALQARLDALGANNPDIRVSTDTAAASAALAGLQAQAEVLDAKRVDIDVSDGGGSIRARTAGIAALVGLIGSIIPALVPIGGLAVAAFGSIASGASAAVPGVAALVLSFQGVGEAVGALNKQEESAAKDGAAAAAQRQQQAQAIAGAQRSLEGAEASLANARENAAQSAATAAATVVKAQADVTKATEDAAEAVAAATRRQTTAADALVLAQDEAAYAARQRAAQVVAAEQNVADVTEAAGDRVQAALRGQAAAEDVLTQSNRTALDLQQQLNDARLDAAQSLEDQSLQLEGNALRQRQLSQQAAKAGAELAKVLDDPTSSVEARDAARLALDQANQSLKELAIRNNRLQAEYDAATAAGVDGAAQVVDAQQAIVDQAAKVADAQQKVADAAQAVADAEVQRTRDIAAAQQALSNTRETTDRAAAASARTVAGAQQAVVDATNAVADAQESGAERILAAQQSVTAAITAQEQNRRQSAVSQESAQRSLIGAQEALAAAYGATGTAGQTAADNVAVAFSNLVPAQAEFARFLYGLKPVLDVLTTAAAGSFLPLLQTALTDLLPLLPTFSTLLSAAGTAFGQLAVQAAGALNGPEFAAFFQFLSTDGLTTFTSLATSLGLFSQGLNGLLIGLQPATDAFNTLFMGWAQDFSDFGNTLSSNPAFQEFVNYIVDSLPAVSETLGKVFTSVGDLVAGIAPYGQVGLDALSALADLLTGLSPALGSLLGLLSNVVITLSAVLTPVIVGLTPFITALADGLGMYLTGAAAELGPVLGEVASALGGALLGVLQELEPTIPLIVGVVGELARSLGGFLVEAIDAVAPLLRIVASTVTQLLQAVLPLLPVLLDLVISALTPLLGVFPLLVPVVLQVADVLVELVRALVPVALQIVQSFLPAFTALVPAVLELVQAFLPLIPVLLQALLPVVLALLPVIVELAGVLGTVLADIITTVVVPIIKNVLVPVLELLSEFVANVLAPVIKFLAEEVVAPAFRGISEAVRLAWENVVQPALDALVKFITEGVGPAATSLWRNIIEPAFQGISAAIKFAWEQVIRPTVQAVADFFTKTLPDAAMWLWHNVIEPVFSGIGDVIRFAWEQVIKPILDLLRAGWQAVGDGLTALKRDYVDPLFRGIGDLVSSVWEGTLKPALSALETFFRDTLGDAVQTGVGLFSKAWGLIQKFAADPVNFVVNTVYNEGIRKLFNDVADKLQLPDKVRLPYVNPIDVANLPVPGFRDGGRIPGSAPHKHADNVDIRATPGEFMQPVDSVRYYGQGFMEAVRRRAIPREMTQGLASGGSVQQLVAFGKKLQGMGYTVSEQSAFGGVTPGAHSKNSWHYRDGAIDINAGAGTSVAEQKRLGMVLPTLANSYGLRSIFMTTGHFNHGHADLAQSKNLGAGSSFGPSEGGILSGVAEAIGGLWDNAKDLASPFTNLLSGIGEKVGTGPWGTFLSAGATNLVGAVKDKVAGAAAALFGGSDDNSDASPVKAGSGVQRWRETALQALDITGSPAAWINSLLRRMEQESGGNPRAINNWDSNAKKGTPSKGLMQVIDPTFRANAMPGYDRDVYDPLSNIIASIRYANRRYGVATTGWDRKGGYALGGLIGQPLLFDSGGMAPEGYSTILNNTGAPEALHTDAAVSAALDAYSRQITDLLAQGSGRTAPVFSGDIYPTQEVDVDLLFSRAGFALAGGSLG